MTCFFAYFLYSSLRLTGKRCLVQQQDKEKGYQFAFPSIEMKCVTREFLHNYIIFYSTLLL